MNVTLTDKQVELLTRLMSTRSDVDSRVNLVIATLAAGAGLDAWEGANLDVEGKVLTFTVAEPAAEG